MEIHVEQGCDTYGELRWQERMSTDTTLSKYTHMQTSVNPHHKWHLSKLYLTYSKQCKNSVFLLAKLFDYERSVTCNGCGLCKRHIAEHIILYCARVHTCREKFWELIIDRLGETVYQRFISLSSGDQIQAMFSGYKLILDNSDFVVWSKLVVSALNNMMMAK